MLVVLVAAVGGAEPVPLCWAVQVLLVVVVSLVVVLLRPVNARAQAAAQAACRAGARVVAAEAEACGARPRAGHEGVAAVLEGLHRGEEAQGR